MSSEKPQWLLAMEEYLTESNQASEEAVDILQPYQLGLDFANEEADLETLFKDLDNNAFDIENTHSALETFSTLQDIIEQSLDNQGMSDSTAKATSIAVESIICSLTGELNQDTSEAFEEFVNTDTRLPATQLALEGIKDLAAKAWEKFIELLQATQKLISDLYVVLLKYIKNNSGKIDKLIKALEVTDENTRGLSNYQDEKLTKMLSGKEFNFNNLLKHIGEVEDIRYKLSEILLNLVEEEPSDSLPIKRINRNIGALIENANLNYGDPQILLLDGKKIKFKVPTTDDSTKIGEFKFDAIEIPVKDIPLQPVDNLEDLIKDLKTCKFLDNRLKSTKSQYDKINKTLIARVKELSKEEITEDHKVLIDAMKQSMTLYAAMVKYQAKCYSITISATMRHANNIIRLRS